MALSASAINLITQTFDADFYLARRPDVAAAGVDPLQHFLNFGFREGNVNFSPLFTINNYLFSNPDVAAAAQLGAINPWEHLLNFGIQEGRSGFSNVFDARYYREQNPDVAASGTNVLQHFLDHGLAEGRNPSANFNLSTFIAANGDASAALASGNISVLQREFLEATQTIRTLTDSGTSVVDALVQTAAAGGANGSGSGGGGGGGFSGGSSNGLTTLGFSNSYTLTDTEFASVGTVLGSAGTDTLTLSSSGATFDFSSKGMTLVETLVYGATTAGLTVDAADIASTTTITGNGSSNTLTLNGTTNLSSTALTNVETLVFAGTLTADAADLSSVTALTGSSTPVLALNDSADLTAINTYSGNISATLASGTTLTIDSGNIVSSGNGIGAITGVSGGGAEAVVLSGGSADMSGVTFTDILSLTISNGATGATATINTGLADVLTTLTGVAGGSAEIAAVTLSSGNLDISQVSSVTNAYFSITGSTGSNVIVGSSASDSIGSGGGTDSLTAGDGADTIAGGSGIDNIIYTAATDGGAANFADATGADSISAFTSATDKILFGTAFNGGAADLDDISADDNFTFATIDLQATNAAIDLDTVEEALYFNNPAGAITLDSASAVATALQATYSTGSLVASSGAKALFVVIDNTDTAFYYYNETGAAANIINAVDLTLLGIRYGSTTIATGDFDFI